MNAHLERPACSLHGCDTQQSPGWVLCATHGLEVAAWLADLPRLFEQLDANPNLPSPSAAREPGSGGSLASLRNPALLDVIVLRDPRSKERSIYDPDGNRCRSVAEVLFARAAQVRDDLPDRTEAPTRQIVIRLRPERNPGPLCPVMARAFRESATPCQHPSCRRAVVLHTVRADPTIATERQLLVDHLDHVLAQDWADEFHAELADLAQQLDRGVVHVVAAGPRCRELHDGEQCTGHVRSAGPSSVRCDACGTVTTGLAVVRRYGAGAVA